MHIPTKMLNDGCVVPAIGFGTFSLQGAAGVRAVDSALKIITAGWIQLSRMKMKEQLDVLLLKARRRAKKSLSHLNYLGAVMNMRKPSIRFKSRFTARI